MNIILSKENPNRAFREILESFYFYLKGGKCDNYQEIVEKE